MNNIGLFVIPIRINKLIDTYRLYLDVLESIEDYGYTHIYIGEHLTDSKEDIQSSLIFASALLARTKKIKVGLSVLALPHYNIKLLVKQLEDLYRLGEGRLLIGFGKGALSSDANYLGFDNSLRQGIFENKLKELFEEINKSNILSKIEKENYFSTILSPSSKGLEVLSSEGFSGISSNFCNSTIKEEHFNTFNSNKNITKNNKWHSIYNTLPHNVIDENPEIYNIVLETYNYIYEKLGHKHAKKIMIKELLYEANKEDLDKKLFYNLTSNVDDVRNHILEMKNNINLGYPIINIFDCLDIPCYVNYIYSLPKDV